MPFAVRRPAAALLSVAAVLLASVATLLLCGLSIDEGVDAFVVKGDRTWRNWQRFHQQFGGEQVLLLGVGGPDPLGAPGLARLGRLEEEIDRRAAGSTPYDVRSLHTVAVARRLMGEGRSEEVRALPLLGASLIAGQADPLVLMTVEMHRPLPPEEAADWVDLITDLKRDAVDRGEELIALGGFILDVAVARANAEQGERLFPLLGGVTVIVLVLLVRSFVGALLVLGTTIITLPVTLAAMMATGHELNMLTSGLPVVLLVLCSTVSLHVLRALMQALPDEDARTAAARGRAVIAGPSLAASLTTGLGFIALTASEIGPVREMGFFSAFGTVVSWAVAVTLLPAAAALGWTPRRAGHDADAGSAHESRRKRSLPVLVGTAVFIVLGFVGALRLRVESNTVRFLPRDHPASLDHDALAARGGGVAGVELVLRTPSPLYFASPEVLGALARAGAAVARLDDVVGTASVVDALSLTRRLVFESVSGTEDETAVVDAFTELDAKVAQDVPPEKRDGVALGPLVALLLGEGEPPSWFEELSDADESELRKLLASWMVADPDGGGAARLQVTGGTSEASAVEGLVASLRPVVRQLEEDIPGVRVELSGSAPVALRVQTTLITSQVTSLLSALLLVGLVLVVALGSWRLALLAAVPNLLPLALLYGGMGWLGIGLDAATVMVGAIALGIAVDDTVHLLACYDPKRAPDDAVEEALNHVRWPVSVTTAVTAGGFSMLAFSTFVPMVKFGLLTAAAMILALVGDLIVLPALMLRFGPSPEVAELLHFTGRGRFGQWSVRTPRRWFLRIRAGWAALQDGRPRDGLGTLDAFLADTRSLPVTPRRQRARAAAAYWRLRCLDAIARSSADGGERQALSAAVQTHRLDFGSRYADVADVAKRVEEMPAT